MIQGVSELSYHHSVPVLVQNSHSDSTHSVLVPGLAAAHLLQRMQDSKTPHSSASAPVVEMAAAAKHQETNVRIGEGIAAIVEKQ